MILPWTPVIIVDMAGSAITFGLAVWCFILARQWAAQKADCVFRNYMAMLTISIVIFAVSRSCSHLLKQALLLSGLPETWRAISPYSGAVNTLVFAVIFAFGIYFHRSKQIHAEIEHYQRNLETMVMERTRELATANASLAAERERLAVTLRSIGDGVITTDTSGRVAIINKVAEELTGWPQQEALGRPLTEVFRLIGEKTRQPGRNPVELVMSAERIVGLAQHTALIARDGTERSITDSGAPIRDKESRIVGVVIVFRDATRELRMEKELQKIEKLESVGVLAGGIAHDFNNILTAILGNISLAKMQLTPGDKLHELMLASEKACKRATSLTRQLLTFAKGGEPVREAASIPEVIRESAEFVLHGENLACHYAIPHDLWLANIDRGQMSQVIQNLIINAKHAMLQGGTIQIKCENLLAPGNESVPLSDTQRYIKISIHDTGSGIPADKIGKIFDPYFSTKEKGSGLGLAITHAIIKKHDGFITVASKPGKGATFTLYLPAAEDQPQAPQPLATATCASSPVKLRILVMDDEAMVRDVVAGMLKSLGYETILTEHGQEALQVFQQRRESATPVDLTIMDLTVPGGMGGREAVAEILRLDPQARVIVASGYSHDPILADYRAYGFTAAIVKPFCLQELESAINRALQG